MAGLVDRYRDLTNALTQFAASMDLLKNAKITMPNNSPQVVAFRDSVIKRFELCYDLLWKSLKDLLLKSYGQEVASPKKVFQECFNQKLISEAELKEALTMSDDRNMTVHTYDNQMAEEVSQKAESHFNLMKKLYSIIKI